MNNILPENAYSSSLAELPEGLLYMADLGEEDGLFFAGEHCPISGGAQVKPGLYRLPLDHETARQLWNLLPWTAPRQVLREERTIGTGDRLGIATLGHIRAVEGFDVLPVLAQQSMRELTLMGNTYDTVLDRVTFQVFQAGYRQGYGADGDHLKTAEEIRMAIGCGVSMITLDCSEHIHCERTSAPLTLELEERYLRQPLQLPGTSLHFTKETLAQAQAVFRDAVGFAIQIYRDCIQGKPVDLEISMDETDQSTTPEQHFFVANELRLAGVEFCTMAPRFYGEFQKGIDYIGDLSRFRQDAAAHAAIARHFGYKLSIHSGSDKFSVFPILGELTGERFHAKTSGTSWLEALRIVAGEDRMLFREIYRYAQEVFQECSRYYHVSTDLSMVPDISTIEDAQLPELLSQDASRQLLHITYGKILGCPEFRRRLYHLWRNAREEYASLLDAHIGRHLALLCPNHRKNG